MQRVPFLVPALQCSRWGDRLCSSPADTPSDSGISEEPGLQGPKAGAQGGVGGRPVQWRPWAWEASFTL